METLSRREGATRIRYVVLGLTVAAYMITYMDRQVMAVARPVIQQQLGISLVMMGWITFSFRIAYALFQIPGGWLGDTIGARRALTLVVTWWSIFTSFTGLAWNAVSMLVIQAFFGMGEAGAFPIATRSLSRWMLPSERGLAQGLTHAGSRLGAALTPPLLLVKYGWRAPFWIFGALGIVWAAIWFWYYRDTPAEHQAVNAAELETIHSALGGGRSRTSHSVPWRKILANATVWNLSVMYFCYSYVLATYLEWFPTYLNNSRHFSLKQMGFYASMPLLAGTAGDLFGGWISDIWAKRSGNLKLARRGVAVFGFLLAGAAILPATFTSSATNSVWYTCLAVFGLELTVGVSWAVTLDIGGDYAGSVSSVMNSCGNIGGAISPAVLAYLVRAYGWNVPFVFASVSCLMGAALFARVDATRRVFAESS
jgi:sugar phosphate permease